MLGADLVAFNNFDYVSHFLVVCTRILGLESYPSRIECVAAAPPPPPLLPPPLRVPRAAAASVAYRARRGG